MTKTRISFTTSKKESRAKYRCPPELDEIICLVNIVPPDMGIQPLEVIFGDKLREEMARNKFHLYVREVPAHWYLISMLQKAFPDTSLVTVIKDVLKHTPQKFREYIESAPHLDDLHKPETDLETFVRMAKKHTNFCNLRDSLNRLVRHLEIERDGVSEYWTWQHFTLTTIVERRSDGKLRGKGLLGLLGTFDDTRLRRCLICKRIFWARRNDSKTCSSRCSNNLNVRNYRSLSDEEKEAKKAQRKENREIIKNGRAKSITREKT